jgi:phosphoribosylcarboxyaminoimidazole (NCAIR) mutase
MLEGSENGTYPFDSGPYGRRYSKGSSTTQSTVTTTSPLVDVIMGSHSDLPSLHAAVEILQHFCIPYEVVDIVAAHCTNGQMNIAGAGGDAHLPGMVAAMIP